MGERFAWRSLDYPTQRKGLSCSLLKCIFMQISAVRALSLVTRLNNEMFALQDLFS